MKLLNIGLKGDITDQMVRYAQILLEANSRFNLTRITDSRGMAIKHIADSLSLLLLDIPPGATVVDVGSGAGLPGIPLAIMRKDLKITLIDATGKKVDFLNGAALSLGLTNCRAIQGRVEIKGHEARHREAYDIVVWRSLGRLALSVEMCLPLVRVGGWAAAMKGPKLDEELSEARAKISLLGGRVDTTISINLPDGLDHRLLRILKIHPTPQDFPRPYAKMKL